MLKKLLFGVLFIGVCVLLVGGTTVKRGPASPAQIHEAVFYIDDPLPVDGECLSSSDIGVTTSCTTNVGKTSHPVNETGRGYTGVMIHRLLCHYMDDDVDLATTDSMVVCVNALVGSAKTATTVCVTMDSQSDVNLASNDVVDNVGEIIPLTEFGLGLLVTGAPVIDGTADWEGVCRVEYSGAN